MKHRIYYNALLFFGNCLFFTMSKRIFLLLFFQWRTEDSNPLHLWRFHRTWSLQVLMCPFYSGDKGNYASLNLGE